MPATSRAVRSVSQGSHMHARPVRSPCHLHSAKLGWWYGNTSDCDNVVKAEVERSRLASWPTQSLYGGLHAHSCHHEGSAACCSALLQDPFGDLGSNPCMRVVLQPTLYVAAELLPLPVVIVLCRNAGEQQQQQAWCF